MENLKTKKIPTLRFSEFSGEWENKALGEVASFSKGKGISKADINEDGYLECIRYGELYTFYGETIRHIKSKTNIDKDGLVLSQYNDVIIPASGETQLDIATASCVLKDGVALGGDLNIIRTKLNGVFLSYYLNNKKKQDIASLSQGISVVHLYSSQLKLLDLNIPLLPEQTKIADFLTQIDNKINQLSQKKQLLERYKKGVMQQIFSQSIRFTDDDGREFPEWEERKLGEITKKISDNRNKKLSDAKVYSVTNSNGFVLQSEHFDRVVAGNDLSNYKIIQKSEFAYNPARINVGSIAYFQDDIGIISSLYVCFKTTNKLLDKFLLSILELDYTKFQIENLGEGGVRIYLWYDLFALIKCKVPCIEEQTKIASFLTALDTKIALVESQLNGTKQYKKGLLQQLFI